MILTLVAGSDLVLDDWFSLEDFILSYKVVRRMRIEEKIDREEGKQRKPRKWDKLQRNWKISYAK